MLLLAALGFAAPALLLTAAAVAIPLWIHRWQTPVDQRLTVPSLRRWEEVLQAGGAGWRWRERLLLALRILAVLLLVVAFAQPRWTTPQVSATPTDGRAVGGEAVVLLLDHSASTAQRTAAGTPLWDDLLAAAQAEFAALRPGLDAAGIVLLDAAPRALEPSLTRDFTRLRKALSTLAPLPQPAAVAQAVLPLTALLAQRPAGQAGRVVILTDGQASTWPPGSLTALGNALPAGTALDLRLVSASAPIANLALVQPQQLHSPDMANGQQRVSVDVHNYSPSPQTSAVEAHANGRSLGTQTLRLPPGGVASVSFELVTEAGRDTLVRWHLAAPDALAGDNTAWLMLPRPSRPRVWLVGEDDPGEVGRGTWFLQRALQPHAGPADRFVVEHRLPAAVDLAGLREVDVVMVTAVPDAPPRLEATLEAWVKAGGCLVIWGGPAPLSTSDLLPWSWVSVSADSRLASAPPRDGIPAATATQSPIPLDLLTSADVGRLWQVRDVDPQATVWLTAADGSPALVHQRSGAGQIVTAAFSPDAQAGRFGADARLVVLAQSLVDTLVGDPVAQPTLAGDPLTLRTSTASPLADAPLLLVLQETGETADAAALIAELPAAEINWTYRTLLATWPTAPAPGVYALQQAAQTLAQAAVNFDPAESDLTAASVRLQAELDAWTDKAAARPAASDSAAISERSLASVSSPAVTSLTSYVLVAMLAVLLVESLVRAGPGPRDMAKRKGVRP